MSNPKEALRDAFIRYVSSFDTTNPKIALKIEHTLNVANLAERIALSEKSLAPLAPLSWAAGILHDIGRFEQVKDYGTFVDARSVDHATLGAQLLFDEGLIDKFVDFDSPSSEKTRALFTKTELQMLKAAVAYHSLWKLPTDLEEPTKALCTILRDADKIDIIRANCDYPVHDIYPFTEEDLLNSQVSPEVVEAFNKRSTIPTPLKKHPADSLLGHCSFGWELEFAESRRIMVEQGNLEKLFERPFTNQITASVFEQGKIDMFEWLRA